MLLTVGHAIDRAKDDGLVVRLNVGGSWMTGQILNSDGHGVAILETSGDLCLVRQNDITCVRLPGAYAGPPPQVPAQPTALDAARRDGH